MVMKQAATGCGGMRNFLFGRGARCGFVPECPAAVSGSSLCPGTTGRTGVAV